MDKTIINEYVTTQVRKLADSRVLPLIQSMDAELANIRLKEEAKAKLDEEILACQNRIVEYQRLVTKNQSVVDDLAVKLTEASKVAVS